MEFPGWVRHRGCENQRRVRLYTQSVPSKPPRVHLCHSTSSHHEPFISDMFGPSGFSGHTPIIQVMPLRGMDLDAFSSGFIETVPTSEENIHPEITPAQRDDDIQTASINSIGEPPMITTGEKGKGEVSERAKSSDLSPKTKVTSTTNLPSTFHTMPTLSLLSPFRRTLKTSMYATTAAQRGQTRFVPPAML